MTEVDASRRRLVEAADEQRRQLERELREGAERRLTAVAELLNAGRPPLAELEVELDAARRALGALAHGIHPATLTNHGLLAALNELGANSPVPVEIIGPGTVMAGSSRGCSLLRRAPKRSPTSPSTRKRPASKFESQATLGTYASRSSTTGSAAPTPHADRASTAWPIAWTHSEALPHYRKRPRSRHKAHRRTPALPRLTGDQPGSAFAGGGHRLLR